MPDETLKSIRGAYINNFVYRRFESHQAILDYIGSSTYMKDDVMTGVCFGFSLSENNQADFKLEIVFNDKVQERDAQQLPSQLLEVALLYSTD